ncbi:MAG: protoporphyrinogen oxidase HemJ [Hyphomicrobium sp.]|uniref:protoporphyrinogen oxidase HemJ n=1 Tax=Hyphomicrobium sp. TaxID=82 RepID=UPI0025B8E081|nr:protoporphyrinogen oxidase HemJ [Hyphomicrobium sp.]MBZ0209424.1 protoporphyrinogen oxidase HemJ [Hyphomicrobium sp.]
MTDLSHGAGAPAIRAAIALAVMVAMLMAASALFGEGAYLWVKAAHIIALIAWMAGMLYLPRLFIYHCDAPPGSAQSETFKVMERRLLTVIINPAMVLTWVLGLWLAWQGGFFTAGWFHAKLALVIALSGVHGFFSAAVRKFAADANTTSQRAWRMWNEVPTVLLVGIVLLVVLKPF